MVRARNQHQRAVELVVVGEHDRRADGAHARHAVLGVPGLEVRVPVEAGALEAVLVVDARLMDIDITAQQLAHHAENTRVARELGETARNAVHVEHRTDRAGFRVANHAVLLEQVLVVTHVLEFLEERRHAFLRKETLERKIAVTLKAREGDFAQRAVPAVLRCGMHHRVAAHEAFCRFARTRHIIVVSHMTSSVGFARPVASARRRAGRAFRTCVRSP